MSERAVVFVSAVALLVESAGFLGLVLCAREEQRSLLCIAAFELYIAFVMTVVVDRLPRRLERHSPMGLEVQVGLHRVEFRHQQPI